MLHTPRLRTALTLCIASVCGCTARLSGGTGDLAESDYGYPDGGGWVDDRGILRDGPSPYDLRPPTRDSRPPTTDQAAPPPTGYFPIQSIWYQDISKAPLDSQSGSIISSVQNNGGWAYGSFTIDFLLHVLYVDDSTSSRHFIATEDFYNPDCDKVAVPVPSVGSIEGESGFECTNLNRDCHLIVVHKTRKKLYEMWRANLVDGEFYGGCLAVWDLTRVYGPSGRGEQCTSADAAGFPIAPLTFTADEVKAGAINHALRFVLPNDRIRNGVYLHPATHSTPSTSGGSDAAPYGVRFRLKASFAMDRLPNAGARVVARALQKYGMFLSDGGGTTLTAQHDRYTTAKWKGLLAYNDLSALKVSDFEVVDGGQRIPYTARCVRNP
ncbi:MAG: hypothetical protein IT371_12260 [Deltaproteobacteria bacterium]|nr:hypothetical protein [Deltaproteobacteria bacterium]